MSTGEQVVRSLTKTLERWVFHDLFYVAGGLLVIGTALFAIDEVQMIASQHWAVVLVVGVTSYSVGYSLTELASFFRLVALTHRKPRSWTISLLKWHSPQVDYKNWKPRRIDNLENWQRVITTEGSSESLAVIRRTKILDQLCATIAANFFASALISLTHLIYLIYINPKSEPESFDILLPIFTLFFWFVLSQMNRIKGAQQYHLEQQIYDRFEPSEKVEKE